MNETTNNLNDIPTVAAPVPAPELPAAAKGPSFAELGLHSDVLRAVEEMGFSEPMPVQATTEPNLRPSLCPLWSQAA